MSETKPVLALVAESARLALARGDRDAARNSLSAALYNPETTASLTVETPAGLLRLGTVYQDAGLLSEAERLFGDAVAVAERTAGKSDPIVGQALAQLGMAMLTRGADAEAESALSRALAIVDRPSAAESAELNDILNTLSRVFLRRGAFDRAAPLLERLLALKRVKGEDHPEVATVLANLVLVRQAAGDHEGAEQLGRRVVQIRERTLAPNHYGIASALELLAETCAARGKVSEAIVLHRRALSIREQTLGVSHASLRTSRERIADLRLQAADEQSVPDSFSSMPLSMPTSTSPRAADVPSPIAPPALRAVEPLAPAPVITRSEVPPKVADFSDQELGIDRHPAARFVEAEPLPTFGDVLSLPDDAVGIDGLPIEQRGVRGAALARLLGDRRTRIAMAAAGLATVFVAVRIAQPRPTSEPQGSSFSSPRLAPAAGSAATRLGAERVASSDSSLVHVASGSLAPRTDAVPPAARSTPQSRASEVRERRTGETDDAPSLEIPRNVKAPLPNVVLQVGDSIGRIAQPRVGGDGFSKQFWTNGLDKTTDADARSPRNAKLIGDMPQPFYPEFLRKNGVEGEVVVQFTVDQSGKPDVSTFEAVRSPHDALTTSVRKVVERMRFEPALTGGPKPLPRTEVVQISFVFKASAK